MPTQRITIAKVAGKAGAATLTRFRRWQQARKSDDPTVVSPNQWNAAAQRQMDRLVASMRTHAQEPPLVFYDEYIDMWSMGDEFGRWLSPPGGRRPINVMSRQADLFCYSLPDDGQLASWLQRAMRLKSLRNRQPQEGRWFVSHLLDATMAWSPIVDRAVLVVVCETSGALVTDDEVTRSLHTTPRWLK